MLQVRHQEQKGGTTQLGEENGHLQSLDWTGRLTQIAFRVGQKLFSLLLC